MKYRAILFDLDGTLLNTLADIAGAANRVLAQRGHPTHELSAFPNFVGHGSRALIERALPATQRDAATIQTCFDAYLEDYGRHWNDNTELYPGIAEMLDQVSRFDVKLAILSNKPHVLTVRCADAHLSKWPFETILGQQDATPNNPDPTAALAIAQQLGVSAGACLFVGDSGVDMQTATAAGMFPAGVLWGFRPESELREQGARVLLSHPSEITPQIRLSA